MSCQCEVITGTVSFCSDHHAYYLHGNRLAGVTSVIKDVLPQDYDGVPEGVLENARVRGVELDTLISRYVAGDLTEIPLGTREDVAELFFRFHDWFCKQNFKKAEAQVLVHDNEIAGTADLRLDGVIYDVKCTYNILPSHHIQVAGYCQLGDSGIMRAGYGRVIHLTKRHNVARIMDVSPQSHRDWKVVRDFWSLKRRLS